MASSQMPESIQLPPSQIHNFNVAYTPSLGAVGSNGGGVGNTSSLNAQPSFVQTNLAGRWGSMFRGNNPGLLEKRRYGSLD